VPDLRLSEKDVQEDRLMKLDVPPVGVKILESLDGFEDVEVFRGVSYCEAVRRVTRSGEVLVTPESIDVCKWAPVVLGLKRPESSFEKGIWPRMDRPVAGYYIAPLAGFRWGVQPDVVILRGSPEQLREITGAIGEQALVSRYRGEIGKTALGVGESRWSLKVKITHTVNRILAWLRRWKSWDRLTRFAFRSERLSSAMERLIRNNMGDMSICRNSTVIPYLEDGANISFFCTGGIAWGANQPSHLTAGFPFEMYERVCARLGFPG
jgi:uncharacterized protein (DUF169 family)